MAKQDYYQVLSVSKDASDAEIKKAYRRLAMKYHPDRNRGDSSAENKFKDAKEAYDILSDSRKRAAYDQFGHAGIDGTGNSFDDGVGDIFESVFGDIFNSRGQQKQANQGADLLYDLELSLEDAVNGSNTKINIRKFAKCHTCNGSGAQKDSSPVVCHTCDGHGQVRMQQGFFSLQQTCPECRGRGKTINDPCHQCHGPGRIKDSKTIAIKIPAGIDNGDRIRLSNEGEAGENSAPPGDLYVQISLKKHSMFVREGNDLHCNVPISYTIAALGGEIELPTLNGRVKLKIPAGTQTNKQFRLSGKGIKSIRSSVKGDLLCQAVIETPINLTKKQKDLLTEFDQTMTDIGTNQHCPKASSWFQDAKNFFSGMAN